MVFSLLEHIWIRYSAVALGWGWGVQTVRKEISPYDLALYIREAMQGQKIVLEDNLDLDFSELSRNVKARKADIYANGTSIRNALRKRLVLPATDVKIRREKTAKLEERIAASLYGVNIVSLLAKSQANNRQSLIAFIQGHGGKPFDFEYHNAL
ncbi:hypothetical protein [Nitrospira sp. M1]